MKIKTAYRAVILATALVLSSCTKYRQLEAEQAEMDAERAELIVQIREIDLKYKSLPRTADAASIQREAEKKRKEVSKYEVSASEKLQKWTGAENTLKSLQERVRAYSLSAN